MGGHHLGVAIDVAAYALGAEWNERHFTKDRTWKGTDHGASLEPTGLSALCRDLEAAYTAMTYKQTDILDLEKEQRAKLKWGQYNKAILEDAASSRAGGYPVAPTDQSAITQLSPMPTEMAPPVAQCARTADVSA